MNHRLSLEAIERAARTIDPVFLNSPQYESEPLSTALGTRLTLKVETLNPIRSFKGRGADFFVRENLQTLAGRDLVCATAGNFGQAMAYACRTQGRALVIYCAENANPLKVDRMRALGAEVRQVGDNFDSAKEAAKQFCADTGARFVEDGLDVAISEGAGTIGLELVRGARFERVLVPLGNGALIGGVARWMKATHPGIKIVGVCSTGADSMHASWHERKVINRPEVTTIADGIGVRTPIAEALKDMRGIVDDVILVSDESIVAAMRLVFEHAGLVTEPAGMAGVGALVEHASLRGTDSATIVCGSNITREQARKWLVDN
jgi:threonine dehydratase